KGTACGAIAVIATKGEIVIGVGERNGGAQGGLVIPGAPAGAGRMRCRQAGSVDQVDGRVAAQARTGFIAEARTDAVAIAPSRHRNGNLDRTTREAIPGVGFLAPECVARRAAT